jgi:hypothetical protein
MGSCLSGASSAPSPPITNYYYESPSKFYNNTRDVNPEMRLHRIPGRIFLNGSSPFASLFCKQGSKGINQDAMLLWEVLFLFILQNAIFFVFSDYWLCCFFSFRPQIANTFVASS